MVFGGDGRNLPDATDLAALFVFFLRDHTATQIFLAVKGAAHIIDAAKAFFRMGASADAIVASACVVAANASFVDLSGSAHGVE